MAGSSCLNPSRSLNMPPSLRRRPDYGRRNRAARAMARAVASEMHAGFCRLARLCAIQFRRINQPRATPPTEVVLADCAPDRDDLRRVPSRLRQGRTVPLRCFWQCGCDVCAGGGAFHELSLAALRATQAYLEAVWEHPAYRLWRDQAAAETEGNPATDAAD